MCMFSRALRPVYILESETFDFEIKEKTILFCNSEFCFIGANQRMRQSLHNVCYLNLSTHTLSISLLSISIKKMFLIFV